MTLAEKCGYIAIIGRPNVGKSTLLNTLIGKKISITSRKPQTTRMQILGIKTIHETQAIYIDTPGIHDSETKAMNRYMNHLATSVISDADVIIFMIAGIRWREEDQLVLKKLKESKAPVILVINKIDLLKEKSQLLPFINTVQTQFPFLHIFPLCARKKNQVEQLQKKIFELLPEGPHLFSAGDVTDKNEIFQVAELIREQLINMTHQELPYSTTVVVDSFKKEKKQIDINAIIWVEREGQKPIVIGKKGAVLKKIGTDARKEIEKLLGEKVFLRLWVKVKENWTDNEKLLHTLGYE